MIFNRKLKRLLSAIIIFLKVNVIYSALPESFGMGPLISTSGAGLASINDWSAVFYNPAGLTHMKHMKPVEQYQAIKKGGTFSADDKPAEYNHMMGMNVIMQIPQMQLQNKGGSGVAERNAAIATNLPAFNILTSGMVFDVRPLIDTPGNVPVKLGLAINQLGAGNKLLKLTEEAQNSYNFMNLGRNSTRMGLFTALSAQVIPDTLSIGLGLNHGAKVEGTVEIPELSSNPDNPPISETQLRITLSPRATAGVLYKHKLTKKDTLFAGFNYRAENAVNANVNIHLTLPLGGLGVLANIRARLLAFYSPETFSAGVTYSRGDLEVMLDFEYQRWSTFALTTSEAAHEEPPNFKDILIPRIGAAVPIGLRLLRNFAPKFKVGYAFVPTFTPDQTGLSNYLDNAKHILSAGLSAFMLRQPPIDLDTFLDISFQYQIWVPRTASKSSRNILTDGTEQPDFTYGGNVMIISITATNPF